MSGDQNKCLDLRKSVYELSCEYPEFIDIMYELGFHEIRKRAMLLSIGRIMTVPKGAALQKIPLDHVIAVFQRHGFVISGLDEEKACSTDSLGIKNTLANRPLCTAQSREAQSRQEQLQAFLKRLNKGESLESVRNDFRRVFSGVAPQEIMQAEQALIQSGLSTNEMTKVCDIHSALFHEDEDHPAGIS